MPSCGKAENQNFFRINSVFCRAGANQPDCPYGIQLRFRVVHLRMKPVLQGESVKAQPIESLGDGVSLVRSPVRIGAAGADNYRRMNGFVIQQKWS